MKKKMSMGLMVALVLLILLAGAALAASQLGLFDYLEGSYNMSMPADAKEAIGQNPLTQTYDLGEVTIAFHEVIADGRWFYFTALVTPKDPAKAWIIPQYSGPDEPAHGYDANWDRKDMRNYMEFAKEEGRQLVYTGVWVEFDSGIEQMFDSVRQSDGTMLFVTGGDLVTTAPTMEVTVRLRASLMDSKGNVVENSEKEQLIPLTVTIAPAAEEKKVYPGEGKFIGDSKVIVDKVTLTKTVLAVYNQVDCHMEDGSPLSDDLYIDFLNEAGLPIGLGTSMSSGSLDINELPEEVTLQVYYYENGKRSTPLTLKAEGK